MEESNISLRKLGMRRISIWLKTENYCKTFFGSLPTFQQSIEYTEKSTVA
jgi:hypothetical protein